MRVRLLRGLLSVLIVAVISAAAFGAEAFADGYGEMEYTVYLNTAPAFADGDKTPGGVNFLNAQIDYDPSQLELISDFDSGFQAAFPKLKESRTIVNNEKPGKLYFNSINTGGYKFNADGDIFVSLRFRLKGSAQIRPYIRLSISELATEETDGFYDYLIKKDVFLRDGIRLTTERTPSYGSVVSGDADCDGVITSADAVCIQRWLARIPVGDFDPGAADVDGDGELTPADALYIARSVVGLA